MALYHNLIIIHGFSRLLLVSLIVLVPIKSCCVGF